MSGPSSDGGMRPYKYVPYRNSLLTMVLKDSLGGYILGSFTHFLLYVCLEVSAAGPVAKNQHSVW